MRRAVLAIGASLVLALSPAWSLADDVAVTLTYVDAAAENVGLAGEFSNWQILPMKKTGEGVWALKLYLKPGYYGYKFVVNGKDWVLDPTNPNRKIVNDIENSGLAVGDVAVPTAPSGAVQFRFRAPDAQSVHLAGSFNNWLDNVQGRISGQERWRMQKTADGTWEISINLPPGRHEFKYVINEGERWETDPTKPTAPSGNSIIEVGTGGVEFVLDEPTANHVVVAGEFNNWSTTANPLTKDPTGKWRTTIPLKPGRYQYKFVVDGNWKPDPANPETAPDGFGGFNSVKIVP
ncbi:MAG: glycogen-binding domain-containing protein [Verrucomicrobiae bacterium]|nr:glycogen-binding domain-containing protein [Verrucomicrobiae bacterium]